MLPLLNGIPRAFRAPSRAPRMRINCSPAAATAVTPTSPPSMAATSTLHHWCCMCIPFSFKQVLRVRRKCPSHHQAPTNFHHVRMIHPQHMDCRTSNSCLPDHHRTIPHEMFRPYITTWVVEAH